MLLRHFDVFVILEEDPGWIALLIKNNVVEAEKQKLINILILNNVDCIIIFSNNCPNKNLYCLGITERIVLLAWILFEDDIKAIFF